MGKMKRLLKKMNPFLNREQLPTDEKIQPIGKEPENLNTEQPPNTIVLTKSDGKKITVSVGSREKISAFLKPQNDETTPLNPQITGNAGVENNEILSRILERRKIRARIPLSDSKKNRSRRGGERRPNRRRSESEISRTTPKVKSNKTNTTGKKFERSSIHITARRIDYSGQITTTTNSPSKSEYRNKKKTRTSHS